MNYILTMSLSGSCMMLMYQVYKLFWGKYIPRRWQYLFTKTVLLYYLIPLPFVGMYYRDLLFEQDYYNVPYYHDEKVIWLLKDKIIFSEGYQRRLWILGLWLLGVIIVMLLQSFRYLKIRKELIKYGGRSSQEDGRLMQKLKGKVKLQKQILLLSGREEQAFSMGIIKPIILWKVPDSMLEKELILEHELRHLKNGDLIWRLLGRIATCIHWFNPLIYWAAKELEQLSEEACDEQVITGRTAEERYQYAKMLVQYAGKKNEKLKWRVALTNDKKKVEERVELIMKNSGKNNKRNIVFSAILLSATILLNSMTTLAYEEVKVLNHSGMEAGTTNYSKVDAMYTLEGQQSIWIENILYDEQFVDEEGNIYPVNMDASACATCTHTYVSGTYINHVLNSSGGCTVYHYECQRCSKCGHAILGDLITPVTYGKCIH